MNECLPLPLPANRTVTGPIFRKDARRFVVDYDCEQDNGIILWSRVVFDDVLSFEYRQVACCRETDVVGSGEVRVLGGSPHLSEVLGRWEQSVGWQEWQQRQGGAARFRHFTIFFDDSACIDVVATAISFPAWEAEIGGPSIKQ